MDEASSAAKAAFALSVIAMLLTIPSLPFAFEALSGDYDADDPPVDIYIGDVGVSLLTFLAAPLVGITSLVVGAIVRRRSAPRSAIPTDRRATDLRTVGRAKLISWLAAIPWTLTFLGAFAASGM